MTNPNKLFNDALNAQTSDYHHKAEKLYQKLLKLDPELHAKATIFYNLGLVKMSLNKYKEAATLFERSNLIKYNDENTWCKCLCLLNLKQWEEGIKLFPARYGETRHSNTAVRFPNLPIPQITDANEAKGKKIIVFNEQGLGDEFLFTTQLNKLDEIVDHALVQVSAETIDQLNEMYKFKNIELADFNKLTPDFVGDFDQYIGLADVFVSLYEYNTPVVNNRFDPINERKVGVCWTTNLKSPNTEKRSIDPNILKNLDFDLVSLQYGEGYGEQLGLEDYLPKNTLETWNLLDKLDVVVTVDTLVAHLAGLKGIPTLLVINKHLDWRWKYRDQEDDRYSMFYPMVEIVDINDDLNMIINDIL